MTRRACTKCGAIISRYAPEKARICSPCESKNLSFEAFLDSFDVHKPTPMTRPGTCKNGHDLSITGVVVDKGGGKFSRRCGECRRDYQANRIRNIRRHTT